MSAFEVPFFVLITNRCNLSCPHCYNELDDLKAVKCKEEDALTFDRLRMLFASLAAQGYQRVYMSGGEALLRADAPEIVAEATSNGLSTAIFTNGHVFTQDLIDRLVSAGLGEVRISLNELAWARSEQQWQKVLTRQTRWIPALRAAGIGVGVIYIISKLNSRFVKEAYRQVHALDAGMKVQPLYLPEHVRRFTAGASSMDAEEWDRLIEEAVERTAAADFEAEAGLEVYGNPWKILRYLRFVRDVYVLGARPDTCPTGPLLVVDSDGWFHPCLFRFDLTCGHISDPEAVAELRTRVESHDELVAAPCFHEECLSAYR